MRTIHGVLTVPVLTAAILVCGGCKQTQEDKDYAEMEAMVEAMGKQMRVVRSPDEKRSTDAALAYMLLLREQGMVGTGRSRSLIKLREFRRVMPLEDYAEALARHLTPAQMKRLHELRVKYDYVQYVEVTP